MMTAGPPPGEPFLVQRGNTVASFDSFGAAEDYAHELARSGFAHERDQIEICHGDRVWASVNTDALDRIWTDFKPVPSAFAKHADG